MTVLGPQLELLRGLQPQELAGTVASVKGLALYVDDLPLPVGSLVRLEKRSRRAGQPILRGEVIGFDGPRSVVMLLSSAEGVGPGMEVVSEQSARAVGVSDALLGRIVDGLGRPLDGRPLPADAAPRALEPPPTAALNRGRIRDPLPTGVRSLDAFCTAGKGQRMGIFSGPGVGTSTLLASIARNTAADVSVIALVGERGREVREFLEETLGPKGLARSVVVVSTGDEPPLLRVRASLVACTVAEHFRDRGADVVLIVDSLTRLAQAQRQIGLTVGEQPASKGYTPSVFAMLPRIIERAGPIEGRGSITGFYSILVEGDDLTEPVSDAARSVLDGHLVLTRKLSSRGHFPAVDVLGSVSRVAEIVCDGHHRRARRALVRLMAAWSEAEEIISIGAYARGSNPDCDVAIAMKPAIDRFLRQEISENAAFPVTCRALLDLEAEALREYEARKKK